MEYRNKVLAFAQATSDTLLCDMVFLAAVDQFKSKGGGKKKAMQIQICFCLPKRGAGALNPFRISPAAADPIPPALLQLNTVDILPVKQALTDNKAKTKGIAEQAGKGGMHKAGAFFRGKIHKFGAIGRTIDDTLFDDVVALVTANGSPLYYMAAAYQEGYANHLDMNGTTAGKLEKLLREGRMGANFETAAMGLY